MISVFLITRIFWKKKHICFFRQNLKQDFFWDFMECKQMSNNKKRKTINTFLLRKINKFNIQDYYRLKMQYLFFKFKIEMSLLAKFLIFQIVCLFLCCFFRMFNNPFLKLNQLFQFTFNSFDLFFLDDTNSAYTPLLTVTYFDVTHKMPRIFQSK